jgi:hypothetical protein
LTRWIDWGMEPAQLDAVLDPYRDATADAFSGFVGGKIGYVDQWPAVQKRYAPLISLLLRDAGYAAQCRDFPGALPGALAGLATPLDNQPFAAERFASLTVAAWSNAALTGDGKSATALADSLAVRLPP